MKFCRKIIAVTLILSICLSPSVFAISKFTDVPESHWAYNSILSIIEKGYMQASVSGEYKPDNYIDKFETSKILALAAGYKYSGSTAAEMAIFDSAYKTYSSILNSYKTKYARWNPNTDREIAYLLQLGIYDASDLDLFIVKTDEKENLRALSRQEAAVYITKLIGKKDSALAQTNTNLFTDDSKINQVFKPYVYYLRSQGIVSGDENNNFNPNGAVSRAAMAVMLDGSIKLRNPDQVVSSGTALIESLSGKIEKVHASLNALQIAYSNGEIKIHKVEPSATIFIDGNIKTFLDLKENMPIIGVLKNNNITDIKAQSVPQEILTPVQSSPTVSENIEYRTLKGIVSDVSPENKTITIEMRVISPSGIITPLKETLYLSENCIITRGEVSVQLSSIFVNDVVNAIVHGGKAYTLEFEEKDRRMNATVISKQTEATLGTNFLIIEDNRGKIHELVVNSQTTLTRKGMGIVNFKDIRIGDSLDLIAEYSIIKEAYAYGYQGYVEGTINEINISNSGVYVMLLDSTGKSEKYYVISGALDVYTLRLNSEVRLKLDSKEIESIVKIR